MPYFIKSVEVSSPQGENKSMGSLTVLLCIWTSFKYPTWLSEVEELL